MINEKVVLGNLLLPRDIEHLVKIEDDIIWEDTAQILLELDNKLKSILDISKRKKVLRIVTEILDNVVKNKLKNPPDVFMGLQTKNKLFFLSQNHISNELLIATLSKLLWVNSLDKPSLQKEYVHQLKNGELSELQGAGLGILEIARKSENPIEFNVESTDSKSSFITILVVVDID